MRLGTTLLFSVLLVKMAFTKEEIRDYEWFLFIANSCSFFWSLGLKNAFMSYYPKQSKETQGLLIFNLMLLFMFTGCLAFGVILTTELFDGVLAGVFSLGVFVILGVTASLAEHILIVKDDSKSLFVYGLASFSTFILFLSVGAWLYHRVDVLLHLLAIWAFFRFVYLLFLVHRYAIYKIDLKLIYTFCLFGIPLIIHVLLGGGMEYVDGFLVDRYFQPADFTLFRYGARELPINTVFISALASAAIPFAVTNLTLTLDDLKKRLTQLMHWLFPVSIVLILISPYIFSIVYNDGFLDSAKIFNVYLLIICSRILLPQVVIYASHKNSILMWVALIELVINISLSLILMKDFGLLGIAFATVIAYLVQKLLLVYYNYKSLGISVHQYINVNVYLVYSLLLYVSYLCSSVMYG